MNPRPAVTVLRETGNTLFLDGDHGFVMPAIRAMRWCIERARETRGIAIAGIRHRQPIVPGYYARMAADAGLIGFGCVNANPLVAPPGGRTAVLGTNPVAYAFPTSRDLPFVLDMATTTAAAYQVRLAAAGGKSLPEGVLLDGDGRASTDPSIFPRKGRLAPLGWPAAGHKGFGLGLVVDALAGILTGSSFGRHLGAEPWDNGSSFWALNVEAFLPRDEFVRAIDAELAELKSGDRLDAVEELFVPGERGHRRRSRLLELGVLPLAEVTWKALTDACAALEIPTPPLQASKTE